VSSAAKVLIVGPSWVGDMVMAQSLYRLLLARQPQPEIHVLAPLWSLPILERMPEVARGIEIAVGHGELGLRTRYALGVRLREERYGQAIVLPRSAKAALVPFFARVPRRTGFRGEWRYGLLNDMRRFDPQLDQTVKRFVALAPERAASTMGLPVPPRPRLRIDPANRERLWRDLDLPRNVRIVAMMPGAEYGPAKRWPSDRFGELAARLAAEGIGVLVLGSAKERYLGEEIVRVAALRLVRNLCGETTLADAIDLLAASDVAVSNDSGLLHVAAATDTHVIALYGSSSPSFTPPLTDAKTVIYLALDCSPCFQRECPLSHLRCLRDIDVGRVLAAVRAQLNARAGSAEASAPVDPAAGARR
jgi:heptosyltransferase-2